MNIPNSLTILRILLIPCYIGLLIYGRFTQALIVLIVAGLTDALDGAIDLIVADTLDGLQVDPFDIFV